MVKGMNDLVKKLIGLGQERRYVTYQEIEEIFPEKILSSADKLDAIYMALNKKDIAVIENEEDFQEEEKKKTKRLSSIRADEKFDDPVRMYLKEMGKVELLDREGEVRIAKKIEKSQRSINRIVFMSCSSIHELRDLFRRLEKNTISLNEILDIKGGSGWLEAVMRE